MLLDSMIKIFMVVIFEDLKDERFIIFFNKKINITVTHTH